MKKQSKVAGLQRRKAISGYLFIAPFIIGFLENVMNLLGVNSYIQQIIEGAIIVLAVAFDVVSKSKKSRKVIIVKEEGNKRA